MPMNVPPQTEGLTLLGAKSTDYTYAEPSSKMLETFPNPSKEKESVVVFETEEFTSLCPITGQPDYAKIRIEYEPMDLCVESKSLKLYLFAFRNERAFGEAIVSKIAADFSAACLPCRCMVSGFFSPRGGVSLTVTEHVE